jgi:hypothetical protein
MAQAGARPAAETARQNHAADVDVQRWASKLLEILPPLADKGAR